VNKKTFEKLVLSLVAAAIAVPFVIARFADRNSFGLILFAIIILVFFIVRHCWKDDVSHPEEKDS